MSTAPPGPAPASDVAALAAARALELPGAQLTHPFGPDTDAYKVRGRLFMLVLEARGTVLVNLKAVPEDGAALREAFPAQVTPGYHMSKRHWISLGPPPADHDDGGPLLDAALVADLVTESYLLVLERNVPRRDWPVDPATFGRG